MKREKRKRQKAPDAATAEGAPKPSEAEEAAKAAASAAVAAAEAHSAPEETRSDTGDTVLELATARERLLRLQADFDNFRKRTTRERGEISARANEDLILELLPVLDTLALARKAAVEHKADTAFVEGLDMVAGQLTAALEKFGLVAVEADGLAFDPNLHEAVSYLPMPDTPEGVVVAQTRKGYMLARKLLRPAQVVVSSGSGDSDVSEEAAECGSTALSGQVENE